MIIIKGWDENSLIQRVFAYNIKYDLDFAECDKDKLAELKGRRLGDMTLCLPEELWYCLDASRIHKWILGYLEVHTGLRVKEFELEVA